MNSRRIAAVALWTLVSGAAESQEEIVGRDKLHAALPEDASFNGVVFSPDGGIAAYVERKGEGDCRVIAGRMKSRKLHDAERPVLAPGGETVAYVGFTEKRRCFVGVGREQGEEYDAVEGLTMTADGLVTAYTAQEGGKPVVVYGNRKGPGLDWAGHPVLNADGSSCAWIAASVAEKETGDWFVLVDGSKSEAYECVGGAPPEAPHAGYPAFAPDGKRVAYAAKQFGRWSMVFDGRRRPGGVRSVGAPVFSRDGSAIAYAAYDESGAYVVAGDRQGERHLFVKDVVLSPDGGAVAYAAKEDGAWYAVAGKGRSGPFDEIYAVAFGAKGRHAGFGVRKGRELWWKVVGVK